MTSTEARTLFSLPIFTNPSGWKFDREISDATVAWVGLIGLVSGSRLGEIAQAHIQDVLEDEGHVALSITASDDGAHEQRVKTPGSQRVIVVHPLVVSLGFLDYVAAIRASGSTLLFPDVAVEGGALRTKEVSRRLNQLVDEVLTRKELVFYSLRHTFKARARAAGVSPDMERQMTGHAPPDVSGRYGLAFVSQLAAEMDKITFPMIPWVEIRKAWQTIDWQSVALRRPSEDQRLT
jgi:integrase